ncbi:MAG: glycosyltransferase family 9 protein [Bacteroidota bacterium]
MKKILIIRFSSIGDIILTSPVVRCLKQQLPGVEIHFVTKRQFAGILEPNPYIDKVYSFKKEVDEVIPELKKEKYDVILDLHKNLRSWRVLMALRRPFHSFSKLNFRKYLLTKFKIHSMPDIHIVDRYFSVANKIGVVNDGKGLDYFINPEDGYPISNLPETHRNGYVALVIGAKHATKQLPAEKLIEICQKITKPLILLGGPEDIPLAKSITTHLTSNDLTTKLFLNLVGMLTLAQSASVIQQANCVITHDTGLMHIAAAFKKPILSIWGNTVPEFGMHPYFPKGMENGSKMMEVKDLSCRPCSKLGYQACPKGHFRCMMEQDTTIISSWANQ